MRPLLPEEWTSETEKAARITFDGQVTEHIGAFEDDKIQIIQNDEMEEPAFNDVDDDNKIMERIRPSTNANAPVSDLTAGSDMLIGAEIYLPHGDRNKIA